VARVGGQAGRERRDQSWSRVVRAARVVASKGRYRARFHTDSVAILPEILRDSSNRPTRPDCDRDLIVDRVERDSENVLQVGVRVHGRVGRRCGRRRGRRAAGGRRNCRRAADVRPEQWLVRDPERLVSHLYEPARQLCQPFARDRAAVGVPGDQQVPGQLGDVPLPGGKRWIRATVDGGDTDAIDRSTRTTDDRLRWRG
jgi:hypothetical protein